MAKVKGRRIRCQDSTKRGRPCQNLVRKRGQFCHVHRKQAVERLRDYFWKSAKLARAIQVFIKLVEWAKGALFERRPQDPFAAAWVKHEKERGLPPRERGYWLPPATIEEVEAEIETRLSEASDSDLRRALRRCEEIETIR